MIPVRFSPRPVRAAVRASRPFLLAALRRLAVALALAGTFVHATLYWPESLILALVVVGGAAWLVVSQAERVTR